MVGNDAPPPVASVVIPAWRLTDELGVCLDSLARMVDAPAHEVIVVVNGVADDVVSTARRHPSAPRVVPLPANVGFGWACNAGAVVARGRYVVFLNDDTQVDSRWLAEMVATAERHDAVCVAGVLLAESGLLHEAGAHVLSTAGTVPRGAGMSVDEAAEAGVLQETSVAYGSGASLLVDAEAFRAIGGFDLRYSPAYYEDVDLQFRLREAGHKVWLAPAARVVHKTNGSTGGRSYFRTWAAARAGALFIERWGAVLQTFPDAAPVDVTLADAVAALPVISRADRVPVDGLDGVLEPERVLTRAAAIQAEYADWLEATLTASDHATMQAKIDELGAHLHDVSQQNHANATRVRELEVVAGRMAHLESMGLFALLCFSVKERVRRRR